MYIYGYTRRFVSASNSTFEKSLVRVARKVRSEIREKSEANARIFMESAFYAIFFLGEFFPSIG